MKRLLCAAILTSASAIAAAPANATGYDVDVIVWNDANRVGAGTRYTTDGSHYYPLGGVWLNPSTGEVCVGFSYQIPQCAGGPISVDPPR